MLLKYYNKFHIILYILHQYTERGNLSTILVYCIIIINMETRLRSIRRLRGLHGFQFIKI